MPYRKSLRKTNLGFFIASGLIFGIGVLSFTSTKSLINDSLWVSHTLEVQASLSQLSTHLLSAEGELDEYVGKHEASVIENYRFHISNVFPELKKIQTLTLDNVVQQERIVELKPLIEAKMKQWDLIARHSLSLSQDSSRKPAQIEKPLEVGDEIIRVIDLMKTFESKLLAERTQRSNHAANIALSIIVFGSSVAILLIAFAAWRINRDMRLRFEAEERSRQHAERAEKASRAQSQFLANMSHEIRTPLNGIIGMTEMVLDTALCETQKKFVSIIQDSSSGLLHIINDILDFSKIDAGKLDLESIPFNLHDLLQKQMDLVVSRAKEKNILLNLAIDPQVPVWVRGDPGRITQVLLNLVGNAIKFTSVGSVSIRVLMEQSVESKTVAVKFMVKDTGIGISNDTANRLFRPFTQADDSTARKYGGTGLGLSISRKLTELMGGSIGVDSIEGYGSTFWFTCKMENFEKQSVSAVVAQPNIVARVDSAKKGHILVVEDNPVNQTLVLAQLRKLGYTTHAVSNGRDAIDAVAVRNYDLILMDCQMPEMDGFETTLLIRKNESIKGIHTPIIALTANALQEDKEHCFKVGMDEFLTKPIKLDDLAKAITRWNLAEQACAC